jgi:predicted transposase YdaD
MLYAEWNWDDAMAFARKEAREDGIEEGMEKERLEIARNLLAEGAAPEFIQKVTGLDMETIKNL